MLYVAVALALFLLTVVIYAACVVAAPRTPKERAADDAAQMEWLRREN